MKNNLIKQNFWNSFYAITNTGKAYELDNIVIYNEKGELITTGCGWFCSAYSTNNDIKENKTINTIYLKREKDFTKKINFIIKSEENYKDGYTLYIYFKDEFLDFKFKGVVLDNFWLYFNYDCFDMNFQKVIGNRETQSTHESYKIEDLKKEITSYNMQHHQKEFIQTLKNINKVLKKYNKLAEEEKNYTLEDYKKIIYESYQQNYNNCMEIIKQEIEEQDKKQDFLGYREKYILENLKEIIQTENKDTYEVYRFIDKQKNYFEYERKLRRITN